MEQPTVRKTYKDKLIPTPIQERELRRVLDLCRSLYNTALEQRITACRRAGASLSRSQQEAELKVIRAAFPEYAAIHSPVVQDVLARLDKTYQAFFRRVRAGEKAGCPRYQGRDRFHSFTFKEYGDGATLENSFLVLSKVGRVAVRGSRTIAGTIKMVTISQEADGWSVCFSCADVPVRPLPATGRETGIGLGLEAFDTVSNGTRIFHPGWYRKAERALKTAQRRVSRRKKGSARRRKAVTLLTKAQQNVMRQRADSHHKTALSLVREHDTIDDEDVQTASLLRNHHLAKSIQDAGWAAFLSILSFKAACAGRSVVAVNPAFTSQRCSEPGCGVIVQKGLSVRWHRRPAGGTTLHRDQNAARNREWLGQCRRGGVAVARLECQLRVPGRALRRGPLPAGHHSGTQTVVCPSGLGASRTSRGERNSKCHLR
jgi:putative transposase